MKGERTDIQAAKAVAVDAAAHESATAAQLAWQYRRAEGARGAFVREAVAFGAMLIEAEQALGSFSTVAEKLDNLSKRGRNGEGRPNSGLEAWLSGHCPEVNYKTAQCYKSMAAKMVAMMGGETPEVLAALRAPHELAISYEPSGAETDGEAGDVETVSDDVIEERERLFTSATSRRKLEQMWLSFAGRGAEGEGRAARAAARLPELTAQESAKRVWAQVMGVVDKRAVVDAVALLPPKVAEACHGRLLELTRLLREQMGVGE